MGNGKLCNDSYSGNDDGSDDNQQESAHHDDLNVSLTLHCFSRSLLLGRVEDCFLISRLETICRKAATRCPQRDQRAGKISAWHSKTTTALPVSGECFQFIICISFL